MGVFMTVEGRELWAPSRETAGLFVEQVRSLERLTGLHSGVGPTVSDEVEIDASQFRDFVEASIRWLAATSSGPLFTMSTGCVQVALALYIRLFGAYPPLPTAVEGVMRKAGNVLDVRGPKPVSTK